MAQKNTKKTKPQNKPKPNKLFLKSIFLVLPHVF